MKKYCNCEQTKDEFGGCVANENWTECMVCGRSINKKDIDEQYITHIEIKTINIITNSELRMLETEILNNLKKWRIKLVNINSEEYLDRQIKKGITNDI